MTRSKLAIVCGTLFALQGAYATAQDTEAPKNRKQAAAAWTDDGLEKVASKDLDIVYARPQATLTGYKQVLLHPISIAFRRDWGKANTGGRTFRIPAADMQKIRDRLSGLLREELLKELAAGGYTLAEAPGDDVLGVELAIRDLYIVAPDLNAPGRVESYAQSAGEMTLVAELSDSVTGETLVQAFDREEATEMSFARRITKGENEAEARKIAAGWARSLRRGLDAARAAR